MIKKGLVFFTVVVMAAITLAMVVAASNSGFAVDDLAAVSISADSETTNSLRRTDAAVITAVRNLLEDSKKSAKPQGSPEIAKLILESSTGSTQQISIVVDGFDVVYAVSADRARTISSDDFYLLVNNTVGGQLYKYCALPAPQAKLGEESVALAPVASTYSYRKLDGKFYAPALPENLSVPRLRVSQGQWPSLVWPQENAARPSNIAVTITGGDSERYTGTWDAATSFTPGQGGVYRVQVVAEFDGNDYQGQITYAFDAEYEAAASTVVGEKATFKVEGSNTHPGEVVVITANNIPEWEKISFTSDIQFVPNFFPTRNSGEYIALFPVSYYTGVGSHYVELGCGGESQRFSITVNDKQFQIQNLTVDESTTQETIESQQANAEYETVIAPLRPVADNTQRWSGKFILPVPDYNVTTQFGMIRYVNGAPTSSRHGAIDLAVPRGTPVKATNSGRVLYAGYLKLTGNTVLIEHGYGLKSWYYHMDSLEVFTGESVASGQKIGEVGSTGFSTGPHLHFGMSVNNVFINPYTVINTDLLPQ